MSDVGDQYEIVRLKRRADFVRVGKGRRWHGKALTLQAARQISSEQAVEVARAGFTLTKKVGCAVVRNRIRRRLKEALRVTPDLGLRPGHDYVFVGRIDAITMPFDALTDEMSRAVRGVNESRPSARRSDAKRPGQHRVNV